MRINKLLLLAFLLILGCMKNPASSDMGSGFSIYFLKDNCLKIDDIKNKNLSEVELDTKPWISTNDIDFYDFSSHCIYLKNSILNYLPDSAAGFVWPEKWWDKPFVCVAFQKPCYYGYLRSSAFNAPPETIYIIDDDPINSYSHYPDDIIHISNLNSGPHYPISNNLDIRNNTNIKNALINDNLFHEGLAIKIDSIKIIENSDTATIVQHTFTITNNDKDNLYILDSDLMSAEIFKFINQGIIFKKKQTNYISYLFDYKKIEPNPLENWQAFWFIKLESRQSITRTFNYKGYRYLQPGEYYCYLVFKNPLNINKNERILSDGRYWLGEVSADPIEISVTQ